MGATPYYYFVGYQPDVNAALHELRQREFRAGRYYPAIASPTFPVMAHSSAPGAQHDSIEEAMEDADADGTCSILDLYYIADEADYGAVTPLDEEKLTELYSTTRPTHAMIEGNADFFEDIERGQGVYITVYKNDEPSEIFFAGYSYD